MRFELDQSLIACAYIHLIVSITCLFINYPKRTCFDQMDASLSIFLLDRSAIRAHARAPHLT
jgi:hypothetical protein